jgi:hypothetical protein
MEQRAHDELSFATRREKMTEFTTIEAAAIARIVVEMARAGRFGEMEQLFAPPLRAVVSAEMVRDAWGAEINKRGPVSTIGEPIIEPMQEEAYTSRTSGRCGHRRSKVQGRVFRCTNKRCRFVWHRDGVGAVNIRYKYRGEFGVPHVVGVMAPPTGLRFWPQACVARAQREAAPL